MRNVKQWFALPSHMIRIWGSIGCNQHRGRATAGPLSSWLGGYPASLISFGLRQNSTSHKEFIQSKISCDGKRLPRTKILHYKYIRRSNREYPPISHQHLTLPARAPVASLLWQPASSRFAPPQISGNASGVWRRRNCYAPSPYPVRVPSPFWGSQWSSLASDHAASRSHALSSLPHALSSLPHALSSLPQAQPSPSGKLWQGLPNLCERRRPLDPACRKELTACSHVREDEVEGWWWLICVAPKHVVSVGSGPKLWRSLSSHAMARCVLSVLLTGSYFEQVS